MLDCNLAKLTKVVYINICASVGIKCYLWLTLAYCQIFLEGVFLFSRMKIVINAISTGVKSSHTTHNTGIMSVCL